MKIIKGQNNKDIAVIDGDECISKWVTESGRLDHDQNMLPLVLKHIPVGGVVIDIGTYIGDHTIAYADKVGENGNVIGFEPSKEAYRCAFFNLKGYKNVDLSNIGIGSVNKRASLEKVETNDGMNFLVDGDEITVKTLDTLFIEENHLDRIDFIKIDCEGYELDVLLGGKKTIMIYKPIMLIEINQFTLQRMGICRDEIFDLLTEYGYGFRNIYPKQSLDEYQMDILCTPK